MSTKTSNEIKRKFEKANENEKLDFKRVKLTTTTTKLKSNPAQTFFASGLGLIFSFLENRELYTISLTCAYWCQVLYKDTPQIKRSYRLEPSNYWFDNCNYFTSPNAKDASTSRLRHHIAELETARLYKVSDLKPLYNFPCIKIMNVNVGIVQKDTIDNFKSLGLNLWPSSLVELKLEVCQSPDHYPDEAITMYAQNMLIQAIAFCCPKLKTFTLSMGWARWDKNTRKDIFVDLSPLTNIDSLEELTLLQDIDFRTVKTIDFLNHSIVTFQNIKQLRRLQMPFWAGHEIRNQEFIEKLSKSSSSSFKHIEYITIPNKLNKNLLACISQFSSLKFLQPSIWLTDSIELLSNFPKLDLLHAHFAQEDGFDEDGEEVEEIDTPINKDYLISTILKHTPMLKELSINIGKIPLDSFDITRLLQGLKHLTSLTIHCVEIQDFKSFLHGPQLKYINIGKSFNVIPGDAFSQIAHLSPLKHLESLFLCDINFENTISSQCNDIYSGSSKYLWIRQFRQFFVDGNFLVNDYYKIRDIDLIQDEMTSIEDDP